MAHDCSDLTAVLLAVGLNASRCELVKDVPGYFESDPNRDPEARHLPGIDYAAALAMASDGCELVQRAALESAEQHALPIVVRSMAGERKTEIGDHVTDSHQKDDDGHGRTEGAEVGVRDTHDSRRAAFRARHGLTRCADFSDVDVRAGGAWHPTQSARASAL